MFQALATPLEPAIIKGGLHTQFYMYIHVLYCTYLLLSVEGHYTCDWPKYLLLHGTTAVRCSCDDCGETEVTLRDRREREREEGEGEEDT